ncbi:MAG TPA: STAS domain-containing protein [Solirubrobacteraceae bacterium]
MADVDEGPATELTFSTRVDPGGARVVSVAGELDSSNAQMLADTMAGVLAERPERVIFELGALRFMDSAGIAVLVRTAAAVETVEIRDPSPIVRRVIEVTGLSQLLRVAS